MNLKNDNLFSLKSGLTQWRKKASNSVVHLQTTIGIGLSVPTPMVMRL